MIIEKIFFYSTTDEYGEFSNFAAFPIKIDGKLWPTSEHYFQAMKFEDPYYVEKIRLTKKPMIAAKLGRDRSHKIKKDWDHLRIEVMTRVVRAKFSQYENLKSLLLSTGEKILVEHTTNDNYWGDGGDGSGQNMLGQILMKIRSELQNKQ